MTENITHVQEATEAYCQERVSDPGLEGQR
jgi:hypothetical protein